MSEHAVLAPSSAPIWAYCSGSVKAQQGRPNPETEENRNGTAAHWAGESMVKGATVKVGDEAPNGVVLDDAMIEGAEVYVEAVKAKIERFPDGELLLEERVSMHELIHPENWGTLDSALLSKDRRWLFIWDYKHGHRDVSPRENWQLIDYVAGLLHRFNIDTKEEQQITAVIAVVQPFSYSPLGPVKEWVVRLSDLRAHWNILRQQAEEAFTRPTLTTGRHCRDCLARMDCAARRRADYNLIDMVREPYEFDVMDSASLAVERQILDDGLRAAQARLDSINDELEQRIRSGDKDSGLALEQKLGRVEWSVDPSVVVSLARQFGVDASKQDVRTPNQVIKSAPAAVRPQLEQVVKKFTQRRPGAVSLVPADETRSARAFRSK